MMKRILLLAALLGAALIPAAAAKTAATTNVSITAAGFVSKNISVAAGDTVKWTNGDTKNHQVACAKCKFTSPVLTPTQTYSYTFTTAGKFAITDVLSNIKGTVTVTAPKVSLTIELPGIEGRRPRASICCSVTCSRRSSNWSKGVSCSAELYDLSSFSCVSAAMSARISSLFS